MEIDTAEPSPAQLLAFSSPARPEAASQSRGPVAAADPAVDEEFLVAPAFCDAAGGPSASQRRTIGEVARG